MNDGRNKAETVLLLLVMIAALAVAVGASGNHLQVHSWLTTASADLDSDHDGIPDLFDLCPGENNVGLPDRDGDGIRDECDLSPDGDGSLHIVFENRPYIMDSRDTATTVTLASR